MIKVSIVVPIYNAENRLCKCLDSLVNQTLADIELILVNDASSDKSAQIIDEYQKKYKDKIIVIHNEKNQGIGKTRNIGIRHATGEYLGFVDSDDTVDKKMYENYYSFAKINKLDMLTANYFKVKDGQKPFVFCSPFFEISSLKENPSILINIEYGPCNKIFKRKLIEDYQIYFDEKRKYEDMPFVAKILYHSKRIGHLKEEYYYYHVHENSETTTMDYRVYDMFEIMNQVNRVFYKEKYLEDELEMLNIQQVTRYMLQQRYQVDNKLKNKFIDDGYNYLNKNFPNWKNNKYYKKTDYLKQVVKNNKWLLKLYCTIFKLKEEL